MPLFIDFREEVQNITYHPPKEGFDYGWGLATLDGMKEYLVTDPFTSKGRNSIAAFNAFLEEREEQCDEFNGSTPICDINFELTRMYVNHPTHCNVFLCLREG